MLSVYGIPCGGRSINSSEFYLAQSDGVCKLGEQKAIIGRMVANL